MSGSKKVTVGYKIYLGMHMILSHGPIDRIRSIKVDGKTAWVGDLVSGRITISAPALFGGEKREGGISGAVDFEPGYLDQPQNDYLQSHLGVDIPAFRRVAGLVLRRVYLGMNPYLKKWSTRCSRVMIRQDGIEQWYPERAQINFRQTTYQPVVLIDESFLVWPGDWGVAPLNADDEVPNYSNSANIGFGTALKNHAYRVTGGATAQKLIDLSVPSRLTFHTMVLDRQYQETMALSIENADGVTFFRFEPVAHSDSDASRSIQVNGVSIGYSLSPGSLYFIQVDFGASFLVMRIFNPSGDQLNSYTAPFDGRQFARSITFTRAQGLFQGVQAYDNLRFHGSPVVMIGHDDMNPAHIIREALTDPDWGIGFLEDDIDDSSFRSAADRLFVEAMGISILWERQVTIEDFIKEIQRHIDAALYCDRRTGKWRLKLIRADYVADEVLVLGEADIERVENYRRPQPGDLLNSITVSYWEAETGDTSTITVDDPALIQIFGQVRGTSVKYDGFTNRNVAARAGRRDLRAMSSPLLSAVLYVKRSSAKDLYPGDAFAFEWPDLHDGRIIMRVSRMALGDGKRNTVRIECVEDVFSLPEAQSIADPDDEWESPSQLPQPAQYRVVRELPYYELVQRIGQANADEQLALNPDLGFVIASAARPGSAINANMSVDAGAGYEDAAVVDFCPFARLSEWAGPADTLLHVKDGSDLDLIQIGTHAELGTELVRVDHVDLDAGTITVGRGVLDTVPAPHAVDTPLLAWDVYADGDTTEYLAGETVSVKLLPVSGAGQVDLIDAPSDALTFDRRVARPYPPGQLMINTAAYPETIAGDADLSVSWAHRDRLQQTSGTLQDTTDGNIGPEDGTTYTLRIYGEHDEIGREVSGIDTTSFVYDIEDEKADFGYPSDVEAQGFVDLIASYSLRAFWKQDESSGTAMAEYTGTHPATHQGSVAGGASPVIGAFDHAANYPAGSSDYTNVPTNVLPASGTTPVVTFVFVFATTKTGAQTLWEKRNSTTQLDNRLAINLNVNAAGSAEAGKARLFTRTVTTNASFAFTGAISAMYDGNPHMLAVEVNGGSSKMYFDGQPVACSGSVLTGQLHGGTGHVIGGRETSSTAPFEGRMNTVAVINGTLTAQQHADLWAVRDNTGDELLLRPSGRLRIELESVRDGLASYQKHNHVLLRNGNGFDNGEWIGE